MDGVCQGVALVCLLSALSLESAEGRVGIAGLLSSRRVADFRGSDSADQAGHLLRAFHDLSRHRLKPSQAQRDIPKNERSRQRGEKPPTMTSAKIRLALVVALLVAGCRGGIRLSSVLRERQAPGRQEAIYRLFRQVQQSPRGKPRRFPSPLSYRNCFFSPVQCTMPQLLH